MNQDDYNSLIQAHKGIKSQVATGPTSKPDPDFPSVTSMATAIPDAQRQQKIVFNDGTYITVQPNEDGTYGIIQPLANSAEHTNDNQAPSTHVLPDGSIGVWDPTSKSYVPVTGAKLTPEEIAANKEKALEDARERQYNSTHPDANGNAYYLTHAELADLHLKQQQENLSDQQIKSEIDARASANQRADAQLKIDQQNADSNTTRTNIEKQNADTQTAAQKAQAAAEAAAGKLAQDQLDWKKKVDEHTMSAEDAQFEYTKEWNEVQRLATAARLEFDKEKQQQDNALQTNTLGETTRHNQATETQNAADTTERQREADQTAEQNRQQLAAQIGEAGAKAMVDSLPFMAPAGTSADLASIRNGMLSDPAHPQAAPPARSVPFPFDPTTIVQQLTAQALANMSPTAKAVAAKNGAAPPAPVAPVAPATTPGQVGAPVATPAGITAPLLPPGDAGSPRDTTFGPQAPSVMTTPSGGTTIVNLHFGAPTGSAAPGSRGSLDSATTIDPVTGQPTNPFDQGVTV